MRISAFAAAAGVSPHTLRYYEKIGLITDVRRDASGTRIYNAADAEWIEWIACLKTAGMTIETIKRYSALRNAGDIPGQVALLEMHIEKTSRRIQEMQSNLAVSQRKLAVLRKDLT